MRTVILVANSLKPEIVTDVLAKIAPLTEEKIKEARRVKQLWDRDGLFWSPYNT